MKKPENQLDVVRAKLANIPKDEWMHVASSANVNIRTIYNVVDIERKPSYDTVYRVYEAISKRGSSRRAAGR